MQTPDPRTPEGYRALRRALGLTQQELADRLEMRRETVGARERGETPIGEEAALALERTAQEVTHGRP